MKKNNFKILIGALAPAAALMAVPTLATSCNNNDVPEQDDYRVQFNAGTGSFVEGEKTSTMVNVGTKFANVVTPRVKKPGKVFAGWAIDEQHTMFMTSNTIIQKNMTLTAVYDDEIIGDVCYVKFQSGDENVTFSGNTTVAVKKHKKFFMINIIFSW